MQLFDRGGQLVSRPTPNPTISPGWANNDLTQTTPPTIGDPDWANAITAELINVLAQVGLSPAKATVNQVLLAIMRIAGGNMTLESAATVTLTADNAGLVLVNAASNNVAITLPASAAANGQSLSFTFVRTDNSANTVTMAAAGSDTSLPTGGFPFTLAVGAQLRLRGDGVSRWVVQSSGVTPFTGIATDTGTANAMVVTLSPPAPSLASIVGVPFLVKKSASASTGAITMALNGLTATSAVLADATAFNASAIWPAGAEAWCMYDGTNIVVLADPHPGGLLRLSNFIGSNQSLAASGYQILPGGLILQWMPTGVIASGSGSALTFPITFPNNLFGLFNGIEGSGLGSSSTAHYYFKSPSTSGVTVYSGEINSFTITGGFLFALGN